MRRFRKRSYFTNDYDVKEVYGHKSSSNSSDWGDRSLDNVLIRKLLIANIDPRTTHKELVREFSTFGKIDNCILKKQKSGKKSYAFITFNQPCAANKAKEAGYRKTIWVDGQYIRVVPAVPWNQPGHPNNQIDPEVCKQDCENKPADDYSYHKTAIDQLNNDCLMQIFSYLSVVDRIKIERVCKRWQSVCLESWCMYRTLDLSASGWGKKEVDAPYLYRVLLRCGTNIHHINLSTHSKVLGNATLIAMSKLCPNIQSLNIEDFNWSPSGTKALAKNCRNIKKLRIGSSIKHQKELSLLFATLNKLNCVEINFDSSMVSKFLLKLPIASIREVVLINPGDGIHKNVSKFLLMARNLRSLRIINYQYHESSLLEYVDVTQLCSPSLQVFSVSLFGDLPSKLNHRTVSLQNINNIKSLKELTLQKCDIVDDDFLQSLSKICKHLSKIDISACDKVTDKGIGHLKSLMLQELHLNYMQAVTDEALSDFASLKELHCFKTYNIHNAGLIRLLEVSPNIKTINVCYCKFISNELIDAAVESTLLMRNRVLKMYVFETSVKLDQIKRSSPFLQLMNTIHYRFHNKY